MTESGQVINLKRLALLVKANNRIDVLEQEIKRLRKALNDPGMEATEYRAFLDLLMCSDPWPTTNSDQRLLEDWANRKARYIGHRDWIGAFHNEARGDAERTQIDNEDDPRFPPEECLDAKHPDDPRHGQAQGINRGNKR